MNTIEEDFLVSAGVKEFGDAGLNRSCPEHMVYNGSAEKLVSSYLVRIGHCIGSFRRKEKGPDESSLHVAADGDDC